MRVFDRWRPLAPLGKPLQILSPQPRYRFGKCKLSGPVYLCARLSGPTLKGSAFLVQHDGFFGQSVCCVGRTHSPRSDVRFLCRRRRYVTECERCREHDRCGRGAERQKPIDQFLKSIDGCKRRANDVAAVPGDSLVLGGRITRPDGLFSSTLRSRRRPRGYLNSRDTHRRRAETSIR